MNNLNLTEEEVQALMYGDCVLDKDENHLYEWVAEEILDVDTEKSSSTIEIVIKHVPSGKFYKTQLGKSQWWRQDEVNAEANWQEVKPKKKTKIEYE